MRAMVLSAAMACTIGTGASAATTLQTDLMVDGLVGYFDQFEENFFATDAGVKFQGTLPSVDVTEFGDGRNWTYATAGTMVLDFLGEVTEFSGQITGFLDVFINRAQDSDEEDSADVRYSTSFTGISADGAEVTFGVSGFAPGAGGFESADFDVADAEALIAGLDEGSFVFDTALGGDLLVSLSLFGSGVGIGDQPGSRYDSISNLPQYAGSPYRVEVAAVPLPASGMLLAFGLVGLAGAYRLRR